MTSKMEFNCKIAHLSKIKKVSHFNSTKELYERISQTFSVPINEILYCTLNTHDFRDMESLLGNYLPFGDLIVVHMCGQSRTFSVQKTNEYLGLTITDNGFGRAFVKKVKAAEPVESLIKPGDHITAIDSLSTIGMRHYEVAKLIREIPQDKSFSISLIEPLHAEDYLVWKPESTLETRQDYIKSPEEDIKGAKLNTTHALTKSPIFPELMESTCEDLINSSLPICRLLSRSEHVKSSSTDRNNLSAYKTTIDKMNLVLESFLGINDNLLAIRIYRLAKENKDSLEGFASAINASELNVFNFGNEIETILWSCANNPEYNLKMNTSVDCIQQSKIVRE